MKYERMKRNATGTIEFTYADRVKLKKWMTKVDKAIREIKDMAAIEISRKIPRDFALKFDEFAAKSYNNLAELWNLIKEALEA